MASDHTYSDFKAAPDQQYGVILTWRIQRSEDEQNQKIRIFLTRLSGRQQKRGKLESAPAILAGLLILLNTLQLLSEYSIDELNEIATIALGTSRCVDTYGLNPEVLRSNG